MGLSQVIYASCSAAFLVLIGLMLLRGRLGTVGIAISGACALTALWAAGSAAMEPSPFGAIAVLDSLRLSSWLVLMVALVSWRDSRSGGLISLPFLLAVSFCFVAIGFDIRSLFVPIAAEFSAPRLHDYLRIGLGVGGLLAAENLLRNADLPQRRNLFPICLALGGMFAFELFLYADRLMMGGSDPILAQGRGLVGLLCVPLLALGMARNRDWRINIHVSHAVVLHTVALVASGVFFLTLAGLSVFVRQFGGQWGSALQLLTLIGSAMVLMSIFGSSRVRVQLKQMIGTHFFSHRFDYRTEWLRFAATVSSMGSIGEEGLSVRVVRALAQIVDSPAGTLWRLQETEFYVSDVGWNAPLGAGLKLAADEPFIKGFQGGDWIQELSSKEKAGENLFEFAGAWLAVPLTHGSRMIAFVVLATPSRSYSLDSETFDLLRAAATQAASYLAEERSARELLDSRLLNEYSKRFAFVIHDIKNLASQLGLVVSNAREHSDDPEFRSDMLRTVEDSVTRMKRLLSQLQAEGVRSAPQLIEPDSIIATLAQELSALGTPVELHLGAQACKVAVDGDEFRSMLFHLINNAREAAPLEPAVIVASSNSRDKVVIDVVDNGPGMDDEFIRDKLFRPFRSTKDGGFGIGAYQTRELLRKAGGELDVISKKGVGTTMRVTIPAHRQPQSIPSVA